MDDGPGCPALPPLTPAEAGLPRAGPGFAVWPPVADNANNPGGPPNPGQAPRFRVVVVDDHPMIRDVVTMACQVRGDLEVVGEADNGFRAVEVCLETGPDALVLDLGLPGLDGFEVMAQLRDLPRPPRVLVLSGLDDQAAMLRCLRGGAAGYLEKTCSVEEIAAAVAAVAGGTRVFSVGHRQGVLSELRRQARLARENARMSGSLTPREREVLTLLVRGLTTRQMSTRLKISERTTAAHIGALYRKIGVRSRTQAAHRAIQLGLVVGAGSAHRPMAAGAR